ncbi:MAG TPA: TetR/AcrR family transcriptional regulator [Solirubrobacterales bacterium]|nr:TetR/AcrR family transcriptional regulator [Solirubrobacterales bacterium]
MMQRSTPRLPGAERRGLILEAAGELFGRGGYEGTRLEDIARAAGVTKPILYRHFDSKRALYLALLERHRDDLSRFAAWPAAGRLEEQVRAALDQWVDYVEEHSYAWKLLFRDSGGGAEIRRFRAEVNDRARTVLAGLIGAFGQARIPESERAPLAELMSMGMASLVLWWIDHPAVPRRVIVDAMTRVWVGILDGATAP